MDYSTGAATAEVRGNSPTPDQGTTCTLVLQTDLSQADFATSGLFAANTAATPSKVWQITVGQQPQNIPDDDLAFPKTNNNTIQVQINFNMAGRTFVDATNLAGPLLLGGGGALMNSALRLTIIVSRDKKKVGNSANLGSPFAMGNGPSCTVFDGVVAASTLNAMNPTSVLFPIGIPSLFSNAGSGKKDSYEILVSVTACVSDVSAGFIFFTQSHDPEMDISM